ncbi:putative F-box protein-like [Capsicum annuum]|uniref:vicilin-like seed storage protein At2g18540 n=1 Tax=Capsicum annuum TaxID=4072 RepID=UPI001FB08F85|nr:vicilin-like seed storage protein At2g18540 [Capsicum annuum]KAF3664292.1 putative F-box protein-like [Capsicum annuum]KAF3677645.1 putative F-box protein-like [Capsicum annuum]
MSVQKSCLKQFQYCCKILFKFLLFVIIISNNVAINVRGLRENEGIPSWEWSSLGPLVKRSERKSVVSTENGEVSSVRVADGTSGFYHLQFITLEPSSLFLPVVLHSDMIFYVHTGSGKLTWMDEDEQKSVDLRIGDVFRLPFGTIFFLESNLDPVRQKLRVYSIFANSGDDLREPLSGPYSSIRKMVVGFDKKVLKAAFNVPEDVIEDVLAGTEVPAIVHGVPKSTKKNNLWEMEAQYMKTIVGRGSYSIFDNQMNKKKKVKLFNVFEEKPDFENCNGWSTVINRKKMPALKGSQIGIYVVNLTKGSMMGPHWNPMATEIGIAIQGEGMVRVVSSSTGTGQRYKNRRYKVEEGDVFAVPRFHPMAQMAFNNNSFVFVGFSTTTKKHHPQYLAGKASVLRTLDRHILEASFNVANTTMDQILEAQGDSVILECTSCAEEELRLMEEERRREEEEESRRKEEEEARKKEEEWRRKEEEARRKEEEEARKAEEERREREAEEARKREEEAAKEKEEERKRQEEEARKWEEEEAKRQEEEIRRRQEEEEARKREEERQREEEAARKRQEEEAKREAEEARRREEEEAAARRQQEEEVARKAAEEAARRQEEEAQKEAEEARRREEAAETRRREEEEAARRQKEEEAEREAEEESRREEEAETRRREEEEAAARRSEEEAAKEAERRRQEEAERQEEEARRQEEEMEKRHQQEEEEEEEETEEGEPGRHERIVSFKNSKFPKSER